MKNLNELRNLNFCIKKRFLTIDSLKCKYISPYDNPTPKDENVPNPYRPSAWQKFNIKGKGFDKEVKKLQSKDTMISNPEKAKMIAENKLNVFVNKLKQKGFTKERKPYNPPENFENSFFEICNQVFNENTKEIILSKNLDDLVIKFKLITKCAELFDHELESSNLYLMKTVKDVYNYYSTPIIGLKTFNFLTEKKDLPKNLHIIKDAIKFNPDDNAFFENRDAYPKKALIHDGVNESKIYDNVKVPIYWPDV